MGFELVKENYTGKIREVTLGKGDKAVTVGGETCLPFYLFEGEMPNKPRIAMEVWDMEPPEWPEAAIAPFKDCLKDPAAWAKKCVDEYGAELVVLQLKSTDPNDKDASPEEAVATVKKVLAAIDVPLIIWGSANVDKDAQVLKAVAEQCENENLVIGPVEDANHKVIGAAVMGFGQTAIASSPIDINLAKQVNILLENLGLSLDRIIVDPTTGGLGYGLEYSYSVMERIGLAALTFGDEKLQLPMINNLGNEVWKCKEAKDTPKDAPLLGDPEKRAILMEAVGAVAYLLAGSNVLIMRHPEAVRMVRSFIDLMMDGGSAKDIAGINKLLPEVSIDYAALAPKPDLSIKEEKKAAAKPAAKKEEKPAAKPAAAKAEAKPAASAAEKPEPKKEIKEEAKPAASASEVAAVDQAALEAKIRAELEAKIRAEFELKAKSEEEAKAKAEAEAKAKAEAEAKAKAEAEAKAKAEAEAKAKEIAAEEEALLKKVQEAQPSGQEETVELVIPDTVMDTILTKLTIFHKRTA